MFIPARTIFQSCGQKFSIFCLILLIPVGPLFLLLVLENFGKSIVILVAVFITYFFVIKVNDKRNTNKQTKRKFERQIKNAANFIPLALKSLKIMILA